MIATKERVAINDIEVPKDFEKDLKHTLNLIKVLDRNTMTAIIKTRNKIDIEETDTFLKFGGR